MLISDNPQKGWLRVRVGDRIGYLHPAHEEAVKLGRLSCSEGTWKLYPEESGKEIQKGGMLTYGETGNP